MIKRWFTYLHEMYPPLARLVVAAVMTAVVYGLMLLELAPTARVRLGWGEAITVLTVFFFLMLLRIADDLKDTETDARLFPERPIPAGRVTVRDLGWLAALGVVLSLALNWPMPNHAFFAALYGYGALMSVWFFQRKRIQPSLVLALITHNPVQILVNAYVLSFVCAKYDLPLVTWFGAGVVVAFYLPAMIWELGRKIKAPSEETAYVTYSKLFGTARAAWFVVGLSWLDAAINIALMAHLTPWAWGLLVCPLGFSVAASWYLKAPVGRSFKRVTEAYLYAYEPLVLALIAALFVGRGA